jgi:hypothetical protein
MNLVRTESIEFWWISIKYAKFIKPRLQSTFQIVTPARLATGATDHHAGSSFSIVRIWSDKQEQKARL